MTSSSSSSLVVTFASPNPSTTITINTATGQSQITPSGFPVYTGAGTPLFYLQISGTPTSTFPATPLIVLSGISGSYSGCIFYGYNNNNGSGYAWTQLVPATGSATFSGGGVTFNPTQLSGGVTLNPTPFYATVVCQ